MSATFSDSPIRNASFSLAWPRIVAESLRRVAHVGDVLAPGPICLPQAATAAVMRAAMAPARSQQLPPTFLYPGQHDSWRRVVAALDGWGGALLLDPVGQGKSWIALAVARIEPGRVVVVVPAILQAQWADVAKRAGVPLQIWTHERCSRGALPTTRPSLVIIDEAHRFRDLSTRRVQVIAPWLVGRRTLLLTATPIVNRIDDLINLLRLALPEDALSLDGIPTLGALASMIIPPPPLRRIAIRGAPPTAASTHRSELRLDSDAAENARGASAVAAIDQLALSNIAAIRRLLASVLLDAAASSDAAFHQALRRYRALLLQSRDAGGASRAMLRRFAGETLEQLVFWPLMGGEIGASELPLADLPRLEQLLCASPMDLPWMAVLARQSNDEVPTVLFTRHRATAAALRAHLGDSVAWVTGSEAGVGPHRIARSSLLAAFGPCRSEWDRYRTIPRVLIATDVAAEGLDLQSAGRIVHVDLPWTATRVAQREGRLLRLGQRHSAVTVIVRTPSPAIEAALAAHARVRRKGRLAEQWLGMLELADATPNAATATPAVSLVASRRTESAIVVVQLVRGRRTGAVVLRRQAHGEWQRVDAVPAHLGDDAHYAMHPDAATADITALLADATRAAITSCIERSRPPALLVSRIHQLARRAAIARDAVMLRQLDRLLRFASAPGTLGAQMMLARLAEADDRELAHATVPEIDATGPIRGTPAAALIARVADQAVAS